MVLFAYQPRSWVMVILPNQHSSESLLGQFGGSRSDMFRGH